MKCLLLSALLFSGAAMAQKISLDNSMVSLIGDSSGDPGLLVDEQGLVGDPLKGDLSDPTTIWSSKTGRRINRAVIDLGTEHDLNHLAIYDRNGTGIVKFYTGETGNWSLLVSQDMNLYKAWRKFSVNAKSRYLMIENMSGYTGVSEVVLYGSPSGSGEAPPAVVAKLNLKASMMSLEGASSGDPIQLIDEQLLVGDPLSGQSSDPVSTWSSSNGKRINKARMNLGQEFVIKHIFLYDRNGTGIFNVYSGTPGNWQRTISQDMNSYKSWRKFDVDLKTQNLLFENSTGYIGVPEIVLYGYPSGSSSVENENQVPVIASLSNIVMNEEESKTITVSASDPDGDIISLSMGGLPAYAKFFDKGNGTGSLTLSPGLGHEGILNLQVKALDSKGGQASRSFSVTIKAAALDGGGGSGPAGKPGVHTSREKGYAGLGYGFLEYIPLDYYTNTFKSYPLVIFLHGLGQRGTGNLAELPRVLKHGVPKLINNGRDFDAVVLSPQCCLNPTQSSWTPSEINKMVDWAKINFRINSRKIYVTGLSMGGNGAWTYARLYPAKVAAVVPVCGAGNGSSNDLGHASVPTWAFHSYDDDVVPYHYTNKRLAFATGGEPLASYPAELNKLSDGSHRLKFNPGSLRSGYFNGASWNWRTGEAAPAFSEKKVYTLYPYGKVRHNSWDQAYGNQQMWDWLFKQSK